MDQKRILVSLYPGYGLGDAVLMSAVLRHVQKYRPDWVVDYRADAGRECVGRGIVANVFAYGQPHPSDHYDAEVQITLYDTWAAWADRPNTRVSSCLHDHFGLPWNAALGRYRVAVSRDASYTAQIFLMSVTSVRPKLHPVPGVVAIHTEGVTAKWKKDLTILQTERICDAVRWLERIPMLMNKYSGDAEENCALIAQCEAFVGIDSGPGKCASATDTPALIVWTGHHPAAFHDPALNTTHLVPVGFHDMPPVCNDPGVVGWFDRSYQVRHYAGDPVIEIAKWLGEVLR